MQYLNVFRIGIFVAIGLMVQGPVLAEETEYPAAYFEPQIIYQAPEVAGQAATESAAPAEAPAEAASEAAEENPYPAAYFEPVIVFQDKDLIAEKEKQLAAEPAPAPAPAKNPEPSAKKGSPAPAESAPAPASDQGGVPFGVLLLLAAIAGGLYWTMFRGKGESSTGSAATGASAADENPAAAGSESEVSGAPEESPEAT